MKDDSYVKRSNSSKSYQYLIGKPLKDAPKTMDIAYPVINDKFVIVDIYFTDEPLPINWEYFENLDCYVELKKPTNRGRGML